LAEATVLTSAARARPKARRLGRGPAPHRHLTWAASIGLHVAALAAWVLVAREPELVRRVDDAPAAMSVSLVAIPAPIAQPLQAPLPTPTTEPTPKHPEQRVLERTQPRPEPPERSEVLEPAPPAPVEPVAAIEPVTQPRKALATPAARTLASDAASAPDADEIDRYVSRVRGLIDARKHYPRQAQRRNVEGTVLMRLRVTADGDVGAIEIVSPAHHLLEKATRTAVERVGGFPPPPDGVSWIEVGVNYRLDG